MNKRLLKKISKKNIVTKEDAQIAWNMVARYLNNIPQISVFCECWDSEFNRKYNLSVINKKDKSEVILIADTTWNK